MAAFIAQGKDKTLTRQSSYSYQEMAFLVTNEHCLHLDDLILRRSMLATLGQLSPELIEEISVIFADIYQWPAEKRQGEVKRTLEILADRHGGVFDN